ncbi:hypothetical protein SAMN03159443_00330 [Pseudomonas sp. NFACC15-1]|nr:hypothetical protein SAMN03159443_00330 [Pseudomonas sp. NFACC15-1]SDB53866.1 hypothetical protein SAMN03159290_04123 [Pseudomonas sp. NFACC13-1]SDW33862.1 hypothetical protein SAMN03159380_00499 [Pseudomonas sp. NFACC14]
MPKLCFMTKWLLSVRIMIMMKSGELSWGKTPAVVYSSLHTPTVSQISFVLSAHD